MHNKNARKQQATSDSKVLNTERSYKRQGHATFKALCWLFFEQWWKAETTVSKHIAFSPFKQRSHFRRMIRGR